MAYPVVQAVSTWALAGTGNATDWGEITLPSGIAAGDLLLALVAADGQPDLVGSPAWHRLKTERNSNAVTAAVFWRIADGSADALAITSSASERGTAIVYRISGANLVEGAAANGSSANSTPAAASASHAGRDYLWVAVRGGDANVVATLAPSGYGDLISLADGTTAGASLNTAYKTGTAAEEAPGPWTVASEQWATFTLAVYQAPRLAGTVRDASGDPLAADLLVIDRAARGLYTHNEYDAPLRSGADGIFSLGMHGPSAAYSLLALDPTGLRRDLLVTRVEPV